MSTTMELLSVGIDDLMPDPTQPRKTFLKEEIERLKDSIAARGVLQPLRVRWDESRQCWHIIIGECRWRAARLAGLTHVPCIRVDGELSEIDALSDQIIENSVRNALRPLELARALEKLKALKGCTSQKLAKELGLSTAEISRTESLLTLAGDVQALVDDRKVPEGTAYIISRLPDEQDQRAMAEAVAAKRMNREAVIQAVQAKVGRRNGKSPKDSRLAFRLDNGVSVTITTDQPALMLADLAAVIKWLSKEAKKRSEAEKKSVEPKPADADDTAAA